MKTCTSLGIPILALVLFLGGLPSSVLNARPEGLLDTLVLGEPSSEAAHGLVENASEVVRGGLDEPARRLLPLQPVSHNGGSLNFALNVDPSAQNYLTVKLWGSDCGAARGRLLLYIEGQQSGYRHEGDIDVLNQSDDEALFQGRFFYQTVALPLSLTRGKTRVSLQIAGLGPMWPYGASFAQKQKPFGQPSRGLYRVYTHTGECFVPDASEKQGRALDRGPRPPGPGEEIIDAMKATVNKRLSRMLEPKSLESVDGRGAEARLLLLAEAYDTPWTVAYRNRRTIDALVRNGDALVRSGSIGRQWTGTGPLGEALVRLGDNSALTEALEQRMEVPADFPAVPNWRPLAPGEEPKLDAKSDRSALVRLSRREVWTRSLRASLDWNRCSGRRFYTNQSMIVDANIYAANRGLLLLDPVRALPEGEARRYLYEAVGIAPWRGNDKRDGSGSENPFGDGYFQVTRKGLTRELGWVGTYGETILKFCRDMAELSGDDKIRTQLLKLQAARLYFRYPSLDKDGYSTMKLTSEIDNRTAHFPLSNGAYGICDIRETWWMELPAFLQDPQSVGAVQQCLADNQYFPRLAQRAEDGDTLGMMRNVDEYRIVKSLPRSAYRLPMTDGQPDFVFSDEEDAVLAIKHGSRRLFVNFYYRQEFGVSGMTRILDLAPDMMRLATVKSRFEMTPSGEEWSRPDIVDFERSGGFPPPGEESHQAWRGEKLPIAKRPEGARHPAYGKWGPFVGKASFYWLRFGDYLIGLNTTEDKNYTLPTPEESGSALDLVTQKRTSLRGGVKVPPLTTVVLYLGQ